MKLAAVFVAAILLLSSARGLQELPIADLTSMEPRTAYTTFFTGCYAEGCALALCPSDVCRHVCCLFSCCDASMRELLTRDRSWHTTLVHCATLPCWQRCASTWGCEQK
jgi:hypothetical protein